jgi:hypothetical protein
MALDNHILTITEPTIKLDELKYKAYNEEEGGSKTSQGYGNEAPLIVINGYTFHDEDIQSMVIDLENKIPTISLTLLDSQAGLMADQFPRDGDVINVRIASRQVDTFKDIRIDFDIDSVAGPKQNAIDKGTGGAKFNLTGRMKIPGMYAEDCKALGKGTSLDHIEMLSTDLGLGLATNIDSSDDEMNLIVGYEPMCDVIDNLIKHSYVSEESFQTYNIDPYYYLNYVDLNKLMDSPEDIETTFANLLDNFNNEEAGGDSEEDKDEGPLLLTNHSKIEGTNFFVSGYSLRQDAGTAAKKNGYKRVLQYFEDDSEEGVVSFEMEPLSSKELKDIEEPQKGRRGEETYKKEIKYKYAGRKNADPETSSTHLNYSFAAVHNHQNMTEATKSKLILQLNGFSPNLHRWQKVPVAIFGETQQQIAAADAVKQAKEEKGFEVKDKVDREDEIKDPSVLDEFLSGFYVIGGMKITYKGADEKVRQTLTLYRREWPGRLNNMG